MKKYLFVLALVPFLAFPACSLVESLAGGVPTNSDEYHETAKAIQTDLDTLQGLLTEIRELESVQDSVAPEMLAKFDSALEELRKAQAVHKAALEAGAPQGEEGPFNILLYLLTLGSGGLGAWGMRKGSQAAKVAHSKAQEERQTTERENAQIHAAIAELKGMVAAGKPSA